MARLLIADNHLVAAAGYRYFLRNETTITDVGVARDEAEIALRLAQGRWDVMLLGLHNAGSGALTLLRKIRAQYPDVRVLVTSSVSEDIYARSALQAGAHGYLPKSASAEEVIAAFRRVLSGQRYFSEPILASAVDKPGSQNLLPHETLSDRERQVFELIGAGVMLTTIGVILNLSVKTVSTYRSRILEKMGLSSNADIVAYVNRHGIND